MDFYLQGKSCFARLARDHLDIMQIYNIVTWLVAKATVVYCNTVSQPRLLSVVYCSVVEYTAAR